MSKRKRQPNPSRVQQPIPSDVQQLVALREQNRALFLFSGGGRKWLDAESKALKAKEIDVKRIVHTRHRDHREWLPIRTARKQVPETFRKLLAKPSELFDLTPAELANLDNIPSKLSKKKRAMLGEFLELYPRYQVLAGFVLDDENEQEIVPEVRASFQKYVDLREEILMQNQGYIIGELKKRFGRYGLTYDLEVKSDAYNAVRNAIDRFDPNRGAQISTCITNVAKNFCLTYLDRLFKKNKREKQVVSKDDDSQSIAQNAPDYRTKRPEEYAIKKETNEKVNLALKSDENELNGLNTRLFFEHLGVEFVNGKLQNSAEGPKTLVQLSVKYGITPQAVFGRIQTAKLRWAPRLKALA